MHTAFIERIMAFRGVLPAYGFEWIELLGGYQGQVDIAGDGLRERGLGSCCRKINWSLPQCGHFNVFPVPGGSSFSV